MCATLGKARKGGAIEVLCVCALGVATVALCWWAVGHGYLL